MAAKGSQPPMVDMKVQMAHMPVPKVQGFPKDVEETKPRGPATYDARNPRNGGNFSLFDGGVKNAGPRRTQNYNQQSGQGYSGPVHPGARRVQGGPNQQIYDLKHPPYYQIWRYQQNAGMSQGGSYNRGIQGPKPGCTNTH